MEGKKRIAISDLERLINCKGSPKRFDELPETTRTVCRALADRLKAALPGTVHGIYLHGAMVFPETDRVVDLDAHSILNRPLSDAEKEAVQAVHRSLTEEFPPLTSDDLDVWYILLEETGQSAPQHQINPNLADTSWALHRAHLRAGYGIVLHGPPPWETFQAPTWPELEASLDGELKFVLDHAVRHPAYCVLNACRLMVSYQSRDVVFSKKTSAEWAMDNFRAWRGLIAAALRDYAENADSGDRQMLAKKTGPFLEFARAVIAAGKSD